MAMDTTLVEGKFGHGGLGHFIKPTDWNYANLAPKGTAPFDWTKGYDVEADIGFTLPDKDQGTNGSCGMQSASYYDQALRGGDERSAKYGYAQIFQPGGGTFGGDIMSLLKSQGLSTEKLCPSYENGKPGSEEFMERIQDITPDIRAEAVDGKLSGYAFILDFNIDVLAQAIRDNKGFIGGLQGQNNGTWLSQYPKPPINSYALWRHWIYFGKAFMVNGKKFIICKNSWGPSTGVKGWQWISEDYVMSGYFELGMTAFFSETSSYMFSKDLSLGMTDADVLFLQKKLNQNAATIITATGPGSPGQETYYFGQLTKNALQKYQTLHKVPATGFFGPMTRTVVNNS